MKGFVGLALTVICSYFAITAPTMIPVTVFFGMVTIIATVGRFIEDAVREIKPALQVTPEE